MQFKQYPNWFILSLLEFKKEKRKEKTGHKEEKQYILFNKPLMQLNKKSNTDSRQNDRMVLSFFCDSAYVDVGNNIKNTSIKLQNVKLAKKKNRFDGENKKKRHIGKESGEVLFRFSFHILGIVHICFL